MFIDSNKLKELTNIDTNVVSKTLSITLETTYILHIEPLLSKSFATEILTKKSNNTLTEIEAQLVSFIERYQAWQTYYDLLPFIYIKTTERGLNQPVADNSNPTADNIYNSFRKTISSTADSFRNQILSLLMDNRREFPSFKPSYSETKTSSSILFFN